MNEHYDFSDKNYKNKKESKIERFLRDVFDDSKDEAPVCRNIDCEFTDKVIDYLAYEWQIDLANYSHDIQTKAMDLIDSLIGKQNVPNTAARIAYEIVPLL